MARVAVFIDYQNVYRRARAVFGLEGAAHFEGQVHPRSVGELIVSKRADHDPTSKLEFVRVYRGLPDGGRDPKGHGACESQVASWTAQPSVQVITRPLRYPRNYPAEKPTEKGIDVQLAIDFVTLALDGKFDVGVLFSADTDLKPALETVVQRGLAQVEVAAWQPAVGHASRLSVPGMKIWCHYLGPADYAAVSDRTNYVRP